MEFMNGADFWNTIILLGALQGFILSVLVWKNRSTHTPAHRLLACLIFLLALACTNLYISESGIEDEYAILQVVQQLLPLIVVMPVGPLVYFYVASLSDPAFRLQKKHSLHFVPVVLDLFPKLVVWVLLVGLVAQWIEPSESDSWGNFIDTYNTYADIPRWFSITFYLILAKKLLHRVGIPASTASLPDSQRKWLHQFVNAFLIFQGIWLLFLIPYVIPSMHGSLLENASYYPIYIPLAILVYWLGFKGYLQSRLTASTKNTLVEENSESSKNLNGAAAFSTEEASEYIDLLKKAMEDGKLYREPALQLQTVSTHTGIPQKTISYVLNNHLRKSFNEFVNEYRLAEVKTRLLEGGDTHLTIAGLALECGFNSQATFQRAFKNSLGVSPREFVSLQSHQSA